MSELLEFLSDKQIRRRWSSFSRREKARVLFTAPGVIGACLFYAFKEWWDEKKRKG